MQNDLCTYTFGMKYKTKPNSVKMVRVPMGSTLFALHYYVPIVNLPHSPPLHSILQRTICPVSLSIHNPRGFSAIDNLKPRWREDKGESRPLWSPLNTLTPDAACKQRAADSSSLQPGRLGAHSEDILCQGFGQHLSEKTHLSLIFFLSLSLQLYGVV